MSRAVTIKSRIDLPVLRISEAYDAEVDNSCKEAAILGSVKARAFFVRGYPRWPMKPHQSHIVSSFRFWKGLPRYNVGPAWLYGVAGPDTPEQGTRGGWENTLGGRAHFYEYGRSAPGHGKNEETGLGSKLYRVVGGNEKAQPPRPYMRPTKPIISRKFNGITHKRLVQLAKKLNVRVK